jgi:curved DNA-binding protein CbpA
MGIWSQLESLIGSYINDLSGETAKRFRSGGYGDPDLDAAYEELDDYLNKDNGRRRAEYSWKDAENNAAAGTSSGAYDGTASAKIKLPPEELRADFECLGVPFGADVETCKTAYKRLLKIHHPDRHAGHEGNFRKATERSAKINAAWDRIEKWRQEK